MGSCKMAIGLCVAILLVMLYYIAKADARASGSVEGLTTDQVAGNIPACLMPDIDPAAGLEVHQTYLARRGWDRPAKANVEGMCGSPDPWNDPWNSNPQWSEDRSSPCIYNENNPIKGGDMKNAPNEVSTVNNNVKTANGKDNKESFSSDELMSSLSGRNGMWGSYEAPAFWDPNPALTAAGFYHNASQGTVSQGTKSVMSTQENFTSEQLLMSAGGGNASNY